MNDTHKDGVRPEIPQVRLLFVNRSYFPDAEATGQLLTELCEDLAPRWGVTVLAGQPNSNPSGAPFKRFGTEVVRGVTVRRLWHTRFPKRLGWGRLLNLVSFTLAAAIAGLAGSRPDLIITETDPPFLCLVGRLLAWWFRVPRIVYLQDIHPELGWALGKLQPTAGLRWLQSRFHAAYRSAARVVVLSQDMADYLVSLEIPRERIAIVPNWVDTSRITPQPKANAVRRELGFDDQFLVMYSGNLGMCQDLDSILEAAALLRDEPRIQFLLAGEGVSKTRLQEMARDRRLTNVRFAGYQPLSRLAESLSAADLQLVPLEATVASFLMPSKLYGILASGTPVLAVAPAGCELATTVVEEQVGAAVAPGNPECLAAEIRAWAAGKREAAACGQRARELAVARFDRRRSVAEFEEVVSSLLRPTGTLLATSDRSTSPCHS